VEIIEPSESVSDASAPPPLPSATRHASGSSSSSVAVAYSAVQLAATAETSVPPIPRTALDLERACASMSKDTCSDRRVAFVKSLVEAANKKPAVQDAGPAAKAGPRSPTTSALTGKKGKKRNRGRGFDTHISAGLLESLHAHRPIEVDVLRTLVRSADEAVQLHLEESGDPTRSSEFIGNLVAFLVSATTCKGGSMAVAMLGS